MYYSFSTYDNTVLWLAKSLANYLSGSPLDIFFESSSRGRIFILYALPLAYVFIIIYNLYMSSYFITNFVISIIGYTKQYLYLQSVSKNDPSYGHWEMDDFLTLKMLPFALMKGNDNRIVHSFHILVSIPQNNFVTGKWIFEWHWNF